MKIIAAVRCIEVLLLLLRGPACCCGERSCTRHFQYIGHDRVAAANTPRMLHNMLSQSRLYMHGTDTCVGSAGGMAVRGMRSVTRWKAPCVQRAHTSSVTVTSMHCGKLTRARHVGYLLQPIQTAFVSKK